MPAFIAAFAIFFCFPFSVPAFESDDLSIAIVGPMSGASAYKGQEMVCGVNLYLDQINAEGGINGKKIRLVIFDDLDDPETAEKKAAEIADQKNILFVVGHRSSDASIAGGKVYKEKHIPALTATATAEGVTLGNEWYFRVVFNNEQQGKIIANYVNQVLGFNTASIIYDENAYGTSLATAFENASQTLGLTVNYKWGFDKKDPDLQGKLREIVRELGAKRNIGVVFLAINEDEAVTLIKEMKDNGVVLPLIGGDALGKSSFPAKFQNFPMERINPGFYSDDIYAATFLIRDAAGLSASQVRADYEKKFGLEPNAAALAYFDAAALGLEAVKHANVTGKDPAGDREKIRNYLANINGTKNAFKGVTGLIYFNNTGDALKTVPVGIYKNTRLISAPVQLSPITHFSEIENLRELETNEGTITTESVAPNDVLEINGMYFRKTNFVYTGIEVIEIDAIQTTDMSCDIDFYLWFRFQEGIEPEKIEFLNATEPVTFDKPVDEKRSGKLIYRKYRIKHTFKADFLSDPPAYGQHVLGMTFRHQNVIQNRLVYIVDVLGMGMGEGEERDKSVGNDFLSPIHGWTVLRSHYFRDVLQKNSMGDPGYLGMDEGKVEYSRFNLGIFVKHTGFTVRGIIKNGPLNYALLLASVLLVVAATLARFIKRYKVFEKRFLFTAIFASALFLITCEIMLLDVLVGRADPHYLKLVTLAFDILWWIIPAHFFTKLIRVFLWGPLEKQTGRTVPSLLIYFIEFSVYMLAFFGIIAFVFDQKLTSLLATSGVIAMIIGLAVQINISNIFSGIAINMERPFRIGDWVKIGNNDEGKVVDITWRTTRIITRDGSLLGVPNHAASESIFRNYSYPSDTFEEWIFVHVDPVHPNGRVEKLLLDATLSTDDRVLAKPGPFARLTGVDDWASRYIVGYCIKNFAGRNAIRNHVWTRILRHLEYAGITPAIKDRQKHGFQAMGGLTTKASDPLGALNEIGMFCSLSRESKKIIKDNMKNRRFKKQEMILGPDTPGDLLYFIVEGVAGLCTKSEGGTPDVEISRLAVGDVFDKTRVAEAGATAIVAISDTCVFEIDKQTYEHLMEEKP